MPQLSPATGSLIFLSTVLLLLCLVLTSKETTPPTAVSTSPKEKSHSIRVIN